MISAQPLDQAIRRVLQLAREYSVEGIVVGWPLNMDDSEGPQGKLVREVAVRLAAATKLDVRLWDERLSSFDADQALAGLFTRKKKKQRQDALAAASILEISFNPAGWKSRARRHLRPERLNASPAGGIMLYFSPAQSNPRMNV